MDAEKELLKAVADIAAFCVIDLSSNLNDAHQEYMDGKIARGAYEYVLARQRNLLIALNKAGYTEMHPIFDYPVKPKSNTIAQHAEPGS